jgi:hypothetical protein
MAEFFWRGGALKMAAVVAVPSVAYTILALEHSLDFIVARAVSGVAVNML